MCSWEADMQSRTNQAAAVLLGHLYTQAAVKKALEERGQGFTVSKRDVLKELHADRSDSGKWNAKFELFTQLFASVTARSLAKSESLQGFARSFGYSVAATGSSCCVNVVFKRAV